MRLNFAEETGVLRLIFCMEPAMIRRSFVLLLAAALSLSALAAPPHVHGVASLDVAVDGNTLSLHLESPMENLIGFEHPAYDPAQKEALNRLLAQLRRPAELFVPTPAAGCVPGKPMLASSLFGTPDKSFNQHGHADLDADFAFSCAHPEQLTGLEVHLIPVFPRTHRVNVQIAGPKGQAAVRLEAGNTHVGL